MTLLKLKRVRWGVRAALALGVAASIAGNVLHAQDNTISRVISAWSPMALLITIELIARVPVHKRGLAAARWLATAVIAGIAAWVSYWHMAAVAVRYGETSASPYLIPLSVDGLVVVASVCLVELGGRIRDAEAPTVPPVADSVSDQDVPPPVDNLSTPEPRVRKPPPSSQARVERAHRRYPGETDKELAQRLNLSTKTVARWRPERAADAAPETEINGKVPDLEGVK